MNYYFHIIYCLLRIGYTVKIMLIPDSGSIIASILAEETVFGEYSPLLPSLVAVYN